MTLKNQITAHNADCDWISDSVILVVCSCSLVRGNISGVLRRVLSPANALAFAALVEPFLVSARVLAGVRQTVDAAANVLRTLYTPNTRCPYIAKYGNSILAIEGTVDAAYFRRSLNTEYLTPLQVEHQSINQSINQSILFFNVAYKQQTATSRITEGRNSYKVRPGRSDGISAR